MRTALFVIVLTAELSVPVWGQQAYVGRYSAFAGYTLLNSPRVNLFENGLQLQAGVTPRAWYALGFDYSLSSGGLVLTPGLLPSALQQELGAQLAELAAAGRFPAGYTLSVPAHSRTQTFAAGPQFAYRKWPRLTLFVRPSIGAIHEVSTPAPIDPIAAGVVAQIVPSGKKRDWTGFYGIGGGFDVIVSRHWALRSQADVVYDHLFNDILKDGRITVRFGIGPYFSFGRSARK